MAWVAKNIDGSEFIFDVHPYEKDGYWFHPRSSSGYTIKIPIGSIKKLTGKDFAWEDEPVELKEE